MRLTLTREGYVGLAMKMVKVGEREIILSEKKLVLRLWERIKRRNACEF
jgi:hypothetical protein